MPWCRLLSIETYSVLILLLNKPHSDSNSINKSYLLPEPVLFFVVYWPKSPKSAALIRIDCYWVRSIQNPVKLPFPPIKKLPNEPEYPLFFMLSKQRDAIWKTMTEIVKNDQRWSLNRQTSLFMMLLGNKLVLSPFRNENTYGFYLGVFRNHPLWCMLI